MLREHSGVICICLRALPCCANTAVSSALPMQTVSVAHGPLGIKLQHGVPPRSSTGESGVYVFSFERSGAGEQGPVELSGKVRPGDVLAFVNGQPVDPADLESALLQLRKVTDLLLARPPPGAVS